MLFRSLIQQVVHRGLIVGDTPALADPAEYLLEHLGAGVLDLNLVADAAKEGLVIDL